jgi:phosphomethylpyrimidine synthase
MHYARRGIITPEMDYVAIRENQKLACLAPYQTNAEREARPGWPSSTSRRSA